MQHCSRSNCSNPAVPPLPAPQDLLLCFEHWCERESYDPVLHRYVPRKTSLDEPTSLLKGASLRAYEAKALREGWVRKGGYYVLPEEGT